MPTRTCIGCRRRRPQPDLVRLARRATGEVVASRAEPGRGAWLCADTTADCLDAAVRRKRLGSAFRAPVDQAAIAGLRRALGSGSGSVGALTAAQEPLGATIATKG